MSALNGSDHDSTPSIENYCNTQWEIAMSKVRSTLRDPDYQLMESIKTFDEFKSSVAKVQHSMDRTFPSDTTLIMPFIDRLLDSLTNLISYMGGFMSGALIETAVLWGLLSLLLRSASKTDSLFLKVLESLRDLGHDLDIFKMHDQTFSRNPLIYEELVDIFMDIIMLWAELIQLLNRNKHSIMAERARTHVSEKFLALSERIKKKSLRIKEKAATSVQLQAGGFSQANLLEELDRLGLLPASNQTNAQESIFPCSNIPFSRNRTFFGRDEEIMEIKRHLEQVDSSDKFRSFALYGTGGIGKTQLALRYAYEMKDSGTEAVLWFNCETGLSLARSFASVAAMLQLEGATEDETSDQNRFIVLRWLRRINRTWLCIFDNVEDLEMFRKAWPVADSGKVLVTSRNDIVSIDPAAGGMEISIFDEAQSSEMILQAVGRDSYSEDEQLAAGKLAARLGGLPLALIIMSSQIKLRKMTIAAFVRLYEKHASKLHKETRGIESFYKHSLATCWQTTFDYISPEAFELLGIIAHLGPDGIPEELFRPLDNDVLPDSLQFCEDDWQYAEVLDELLQSSILRKDLDKNVYSIHRLVQEEFRNIMKSDSRTRAFVTASTLLDHAFPKLVLGQSMRPHWTQCKRYVQHVLILCARWQEYKFKPAESGDFEPFLSLSKSCGWYLMESGAWSEQIELMNAAMAICEDKESLTYAILANSRGAMEGERAHCSEAYKYMTPSLGIFRRVYGDNHTEVGNGFNNYGNIVLQNLEDGACEIAIEHYHRALAIFESNGPEVRKKLNHLPHTNLSRAHLVLKNYDKSIHHAEESRKWAVAFLGEGCHFDGLADYQIGNALFATGNYDEAEKHWSRALDLFRRENETHPVTNAARMKLSMIMTQRGQHDDAIKSLQKVLIIAKLKSGSKGDKGEVARVQRQLARAYQAKGDLEQAESLKAEAEAMRKAVQGSRFESLPDTELSYAMMNFHAFW